MLKSLERPGRTAPVLVALDSRGKQFSSEELADFVRQHQERGTQELIFAVGPADGWTAAALTLAQQTLSLGKITLPHELARVVLAEQIYRAFTILNHHPYHGGPLSTTRARSSQRLHGLSGDVDGTGDDNHASAPSARASCRGEFHTLAHACRH